MKSIRYFSTIICIIFFANNVLGQDFITPVVNCVSFDESKGVYIAHFGYINESDEKIIISAGKENKLTPNKYKGQITEFLPGAHNFAFSIEFNGSDLTWHIDSDPLHVNVKSSTANMSYTACNSVPSVVVSSAVLDINSGEPIPNVNVLAIDAQIQTQTSSDGTFELGPVQEDDTLQFTLADYLPLKVAVIDLGNTAILLQKETIVLPLVSSVVLDVNTGEPIPNVNVLAINSQIETKTSIDGTFELGPVQEDDTLKFSLNGYLPAKVPVNEVDTLDILLQKEITGLEPVFSSSKILENDNLWPELYYLADQNENGVIFGTNDIFQIDSTDNTVLIEVWANVGADMSALRSFVALYGLRDEISGGSNLLITGWFPIENLKRLNENDTLINFVRPVFTPISSQGLVTSQADSAMKADWARNGYLLGGSGVKIGVLSDSYDASGMDAASIVANGDLPGSENSGNSNSVEVLKDNPRGSNEGMGMLEIVHDVAPQADLGFRTGFLSPGDMANGIRELADAGYDVIVDDITYLTEPFRPTGQIAKAVEYAAGHGAHYLTSAGNFGEKSYGSKFTPSANPLTFPYLPSANNYAHDFGGGDIFQKISLEPGVYIMELQWDDLFYSQDELPGTAYDMDIWVVDGFGNLLYSGNRFNTGEDPIEITAFRITEQTIVNIMITGEAIPADLDFQYVIFKGDGWNFLEFPANSSTVVGHASSDALSSVGAIFYGYTPEFTNDSSLIKTNPYSSRGGNLMGSTLNKPDFIAVDGANTSSFGSDIQFDNDNFPNFFGTSAAAPHAAGFMAVVLEAYDRFYDNSTTAIKNEITAGDLRALLAANSLDLDELGVDNTSGAGLIDAKATLESLANATPQNPRIILTDTTVVPGKEQFTLTINGDFLNENTQVLLRGEPLVITNKVALNDVTTQIQATVDPFIGNPPINFYTSPKERTNGKDGGYSDSVYFFTPQIQTVTISVTDTTKKYGEALPEFSYTISPQMSAEELALLPEIKIETQANSLSNVGTYFVAPSFGVDADGNPIEAPVALQELYKFEFDNGALIVDPLPLTITPNSQTITYGQPLNPITFTYDFGEGYVIPYADSVLYKIQQEHGTQVLVDTVALLNKAIAIVNKAIPIVNNTAWTISDMALNKAIAIVNDQPVIQIEYSLLEEYQNSPSGTLVNKAIAIVNSKSLVNGEAFISLTDEDGNVISNKAIAIVNKAIAIVNKAIAIVNEETGETAIDKTAMIVSDEDDDIENFSSINLITGLNAASADNPQYIIPGALFSSNFLVSYEAGELIIEKAELKLIAGDTVINEAAELPKFSATTEGYLFNDTYSNVFGDIIPNFTVNPTYDGSAGLYDIIPSIEEPENYYITSESGVLYVNPTISGNKIKVQLECTELLENDFDGNTVRAYFSYENKDNIPWYIAKGENNQIVGIENYKGEVPEVFMPGLHVFSIDWDGTKMNWQVYSTSIDKTNYASSETATSQGCIIASSGIITETAHFNYYPNPTTDFVNITFTTGTVNDASIMVYDEQGNQHYVEVYKDVFKNEAKADLTSLPANTYIIFVNHLDQLASIRIQKQ